jgi:hypothetical protein
MQMSGFSRLACPNRTRKIGGQAGQIELLRLVAEFVG